MDIETQDPREDLGWAPGYFIALSDLGYIGTTTHRCWVLNSPSELRFLPMLASRWGTSLSPLTFIPPCFMERSGLWWLENGHSGALNVIE